jgi:hypothetical protein
MPISELRFHSSLVRFSDQTPGNGSVPAGREVTGAPSMCWGCAEMAVRRIINIHDSARRTSGVGKTRIISDPG